MSESEFRKLLLKYGLASARNNGERAVGFFNEIIKLWNTRPSSPGEAWILVEERLPEKTNYYDVTICKDGEYRLQVMLWRNSHWQVFLMNGNRWMLTGWGEELNGQIIAWREKCQPYIPPPSESGDNPASPTATPGQGATDS